MRTVMYNLVTTQTGTAAGAASLTIKQPGRIIGCLITQSGVGGASTGNHTASVELNNTAQANGETTDAPREVILASAHAQWAAGTGAAQSGSNGGGGYIPLSVPVKAADTLALSIVQTGTAPGSAKTIARVWVQEG